MANNLFELREFKQEDLPFVMSTTLNGIYYGSPWHNSFDKRLFMDTYKVMLAKMIASPDIIVMVACSSEDDNLIMGYSLLSADYQTVHWAYVKKIYRGAGISKALVPQFPTAYTHLTEDSKTWIKKFQSNPVFNPFLLGVL